MASILSTSRTFVDKTLAEPMIYIYLYSDALPVAVTFLPGEEGSVIASASLILDEELTDETMGDLEEYLNQEFDWITIEKLKA